MKFKSLGSCLDLVETLQPSRLQHLLPDPLLHEEEEEAFCFYPMKARWRLSPNCLDEPHTDRPVVAGNGTHNLHGVCVRAWRVSQSFTRLLTEFPAGFNHVEIV